MTAHWGAEKEQQKAIAQRRKHAKLGENLILLCAPGGLGAIKYLERIRCL